MNAHPATLFWPMNGHPDRDECSPRHPVLAKSPWRASGSRASSATDPHTWMRPDGASAPVEPNPCITAQAEAKTRERTHTAACVSSAVPREECSVPHPAPLARGRPHCEIGVTTARLAAPGTRVTTEKGNLGLQVRRGWPARAGMASSDPLSRPDATPAVFANIFPHELRRLPTLAGRTMDASVDPTRHQATAITPPLHATALPLKWAVRLQGQWQEGDCWVRGLAGLWRTPSQYSPVYHDGTCSVGTPG